MIFGEGILTTINIVSSDLYADLIFPDSEIYQLVSQAIPKMLDALGFVFGAGHIEIRVFNEKVYLIDISPRLGGRIDFSAIREIFGTDHIELLYQAYFEPNLLKKLYFPKVHAKYVYLKSEMEGVIHNLPDMLPFYEVKSLLKMHLFLKRGDFLFNTFKNKVKGYSDPGYAYMINEDIQRLNSDYEKLYELERKLYLKMIDAF